MTDLKWLKRTREARVEQDTLARLQGRLEAAQEVLAMAAAEDDLAVSRQLRDIAAQLRESVRDDMPRPPALPMPDKPMGLDDHGNIIWAKE